ncbi:mannose-1-phosphate guanylyltransferase (GDP) /mannose-6-phosphate isomerase, type 2 [Desulfotomaculum arcticum]|uniref:mannose-1-phosphate guanylyltransferase n=1 Tax=Desulfotruncus arcticus DSM 17038 TaxID=1121424 RepID=A0A1I2Q2H3_9FIRM|nr:mannose-1-phosphate guanylyltransferase/mannose-6-phosphate isomerase [Desulfotruncus arcticus]SFG22705.1 mannose-1-phosphate guanylyltransferase (GDP) /mannose-6-phosphate isomerase, type 2 [Desulfotomaculum arcticum] [Desulfotruncus arcticus DSM 17038]
MKTIILAGGSGTRLWPLSRDNFPKQFLKLKNMDKSIFQMSFERCLKLTGLDEIYIITNINYKFWVLGQIEELGYKFNEGHILVEPSGKNTLPAIYYAIVEIHKSGADIVAVFPSDHLIEDDDELTRVIKQGEQLAGDYIITFGVHPGTPHTGYGYIRPKEPLTIGYAVEEFKEKPDLQTAQVYVEKGYLWNSGMFMFKTDVFIEEVRQHCPEVYNAFQLSDINEVYNKTISISIDYGIMEKSGRAAVIPVDIKWSDLGSFDAFYEEFPGDENGNIAFHEVTLINSDNNLLYTDQDKAVAVIGAEDLIVVDEKDALLICKKGYSEKVKDVVNKLKSNNDPRADFHLTTYRPWGSYTILEEGFFYKIKRISVLPGKKLSLQLHHHRSEHWVVVKGTAKVTVNSSVNFVCSGESTFVKSGYKHRLENPGKVLLEVIEVQLGEYLEEDDIIRFHDDFGRAETDDARSDLSSSYVKKLLLPEIKTKQLELTSSFDASCT